MSAIPVFSPDQFSSSVVAQPPDLTIGEMWAITAFATMTDCVLHKFLDEGLVFASKEFASCILIVVPRQGMVAQNLQALSARITAYSAKPPKYAFIESYELFRMTVRQLNSAEILPMKMYGVAKDKNLACLPVTTPFILTNV